MESNKAVSKQSGEYPKKVILAIDGATKSGWAIWRKGKIVKSGTKRFNASTRLNGYYDWLMESIVKWKITDVVVEDVYREHTRIMDKTFMALSKMQGVVEMVCYSKGIIPEYADPIKVKRYMINGTTRNRKRDKQRMVSRVTFLGYKLQTSNADDEADAIGILLYYLDRKNIPIKHPKK